MRKFVGMIAMLVYIGLYAAAAVTIGGVIKNPWAQLGFYVVAGIIWVFPLRPLFAWMHASKKAD